MSAHSSQTLTFSISPAPALILIFVITQNCGTDTESFPHFYFDMMFVIIFTSVTAKGFFVFLSFGFGSNE